MHELSPPAITASQRDLVRAMKRLDQRGCAAPPIEIRYETGEYLGALTPITPCEAQDDQLCASLCRWRRMYKQCFLTQFEPTLQRTQRWLTDRVLPDDTRILFLIRDPDDQPVGHIGLCHITGQCAEVDNVLRGETGGPARSVYFAQLALLAWSFAELDVASACLRVIDTNVRAIRLYRSLGFVACASSPLWQYESDGDMCLTTVPPAEAQSTGRHLVRMELTREEFNALHTWVYSLTKGDVWTR